MRDDPLSTSLFDFYRAPAASAATAYLAEALAVVRVERQREANEVSASLRSAKRDLHARAAGGERREPQARQIGPYLVYERLGQGTEGVVYRAQRHDSDQPVAFKIPGGGDATLAESLSRALADGDDGVAAALDGWPAGLVRIYEWGEWEDQRWVARELADETLWSYMLREGPLRTDQALALFEVACRGMAWLWDLNMGGEANEVSASLRSARSEPTAVASPIGGWSAHARNVYRFRGEGEVSASLRSAALVWKIGDFGRAWEWPIDTVVDAVDGGSNGDVDEENRRLAVLAEENRRLADAERRRRMNDCAMLGGLLCQCLSGRRWQWFFLALNKQPFCSARYPLTGDREVDEALSRIVNRAWRGDSGGGPLLANDGRGDQTVYDDALELLDDVRSVLTDATV